jgi:hypothetical protein
MKIEFTTFAEEDGEYSTGLDTNDSSNLTGIDADVDAFIARVLKLMKRHIARITLLAAEKRAGRTKDELYAIWDNDDWPSCAADDIISRIREDRNILDEHP